MKLISNIAVCIPFRFFEDKNNQIQDKIGFIITEFDAQ